MKNPIQYETERDWPVITEAAVMDIDNDCLQKAITSDDTK